MEGYDYTNCGEFTTYCNWWGGNLRGVADHPVVISAPDKLVYSVHDYGPDIYMQPWFKKDFDIKLGPCLPETVNTLLNISHHKYTGTCVIPFGYHIDNGLLHQIAVLVLVHQNLRKPFPV